MSRLFITVAIVRGQCYQQRLRFCSHCAHAVETITNNARLPAVGHYTFFIPFFSQSWKGNFIRQCQLSDQTLPTTGTNQLALIPPPPYQHDKWNWFLHGLGHGKLHQRGLTDWRFEPKGCAESEGLARVFSSKPGGFQFDPQCPQPHLQTSFGIQGAYTLPSL